MTRERVKPFHTYEVALYRMDWQRIKKDKNLHYKALLILLFCFLYLPFLDKAFHIDDVAFINLSKMIGWNPLNAKPEDYPYMGIMQEDTLPYEATHPLLIPYVIKILDNIAGEKEIFFHSFFLIFPALTIYGLTKLNNALFSNNKDLSLIIFFISTPAFLVNSHNVMTDVPTIAFLLTGMAFFFKAIEYNSIKFSFLGGVFFTAGIFSSYHIGFFIIPILFYVFKLRRLNLRLITGLLIPILTLLIWLLLIYYIYEIFPFFKSKISYGVSIKDEILRGLQIENLTAKLINIPAIIGMSTIFLLLYYHISKETLKRFILKISIYTLFSLPLFLKITSLSSLKAAWLSLLFSVGILSIIDAIKIILKDVNHEDKIKKAFLLIWILAVMIYNILIFPFSCARYLLPLIPPIYLIYLSDIKRVYNEKRNLYNKVTLFLSIIFGFICAYSDYKYADTYREFSEEVKDFRMNIEKTITVWYIGEWGMRYYLDRVGARYLLRYSIEPKKGDFVIVPEMPNFWSPELIIPRLRLYATREFKWGFPVRLFNRRSSAGFYAHHWGLLPFAISTEPLEFFRIYEVYY